MPSMIGTALALAHRSLAVFPCVPREKRPATANGCKDATTDADTIRQWWTQEPSYNVAIATGAASGVFAVDVDGLDAEVELRKLEADHGALPATVEVDHRARPAHLFQDAGRADAQLGGKDRRRHRRARRRRLRAGAAIGAPERQGYAWSVDSAATVAAAPAWLLARIAEPERQRQTAGTGLGVARADRGRRVRGPAQRRAGADHRLPAAPPYRPGIRRRARAQFQRGRCEPPLTEKEVSRIVDSICRP